MIALARKISPYMWLPVFQLMLIVCCFPCYGYQLMTQTTTYLKTEQEYLLLKPEYAVAQAQQDITENRIKLFFEDNSEYPTVLAIDESYTGRFPYNHVSIGQGCFDPINDEQGSHSYRKSYQQALQYGRLYNQAISAHFDSLQKQPISNSTGQLLENATTLFLGSPSDYVQAVMTLDDIHPLFGGRDVEVKGNGSVRIQCLSAQPGHGQLQSFENEFKLDAEDTQRLIAAFIENDFIAIELDENPQLTVDTAQPSLVLKNSKGETHRLTGWVTNLPPLSTSDMPVKPVERFDRIYREMLRIEHCR